jgi:hypothetical protein
VRARRKRIASAGQNSQAANRRFTGIFRGNAFGPW